MKVKGFFYTFTSYCEVEKSGYSHLAHNQKIEGSNPFLATRYKKEGGKSLREKKTSNLYSGFFVSKYFVHLLHAKNFELHIKRIFEVLSRCP